ncbi:unnamed protein product [Caenorhabditis sp. 36 PRJEB53466]|nr:unnamed protein product [Caenorhabditis sp. 36 PRJEB53466]
MSIFFLLLFAPAVFTAVQLHNHVGFIAFSEPVPAFLSDMSLKAQYDYKMILENTSIPIRTKTTNFNAWAKTYNVTTQFNQFEAQQNATRVQFEQNVTRVITQLSSVNAQITKIFENSTLSVDEQRETVEELAEQQSSQEVATLLYLRRLFNPQDPLSSKRSSV